MNSPCRSAVGIIDSCTRPAMKLPGGKARKSMRWKWRGHSGRKHMARRTRRCSQAAPKLSELQAKLDGVRREVRNLTVMGMDPNQAPEQAALIKELERSARA